MNTLPNKYNVIKECDLFEDLPQALLEKLAKHAQVINPTQGDYIIRENEASDSLYIIISGSVQVTKLDKKTTGEYVVSTLRSHEVVGEIGWLTSTARSSSVIIAEKKTTLLKIMYTNLDTLNHDHTHSNIIRQKLTQKLTQKLHSSNEHTVMMLEKQKVALVERIKMGSFVITLVSMLCFFMFSMRLLAASVNLVRSPTLILAILLGFIFIFSIYLVKKTGITRQGCGITLDNWRLSVKESLLFSIPIVLFLLLLKAILITAVPAYQHVPLFDFFSSLKVSDLDMQGKIYVWSYTVALYALFAPLQEWFARGLLFSRLEKFFYGPKRTATAIFISSLIFSSSHLFYLPVQLALIAFVFGLFWGWMYSRHRTLIGVSLSHALIGLVGLKIISFTEIYLTNPFS